MINNTTQLIINYIYKDNVFIFLHKNVLHGFEVAIHIGLTQTHVKFSKDMIYFKSVYQTQKHWKLWSGKKIHRNSCLKYII